MFGHGQGVFQRNETEVIGLSRIRGRIAMRHGQTTTDQHIETDQLALFGNGNEVQIVGVHIDRHC